MTPLFRARVGAKKAYPTSWAAVQYERGFNEFPNHPPGLSHGPRMEGYRDAEQAHADAASQDRRTFSISSHGELT